MIQSWENLVTDGRTNRQRDGQADESDFIGRCPTNVERTIINVNSALSGTLEILDHSFKLKIMLNNTTALFTKVIVCVVKTMSLSPWEMFKDGLNMKTQISNLNQLNS